MIILITGRVRPRIIKSCLSPRFWWITLAYWPRGVSCEAWTKCFVQEDWSCIPHQLDSPWLFFSNYTIHRRHSQHTHTHPYEYTHANPTPRSIFEDYASKSSRLTKSPQASRCRRERRLPLKAQMPLNSEKFAPTGSRTQDLRCYRGSCNH
jgi:hypothetical protein